MADFPQFDNATTIRANLVRYEDRFAVLNSESLGEFHWPVKNLPDNMQSGDAVILTAATQKTEQEADYVRMRRLLEEMIN